MLEAVLDAPLSPPLRPYHKGSQSLEAAIRALLPDAWYDPSDLTTLFQDSAGTTPVTALEQPVGLMLDKSRGLVLGSELVPDSGFDSASAWTAQNSDWAVSGGKATYTESATAVVYLESNANISIDAGKWYEVRYTISGIASGSAVFGLFNKTASVNLLGAYFEHLSNGSYVRRFFVSSSVTGLRIYGNNSGTATSWSLESISVRELPGYHAYHTPGDTTTRPVVSRRINFAEKTEAFDDAYWTKVAVSVSQNTTETLDPLGGNAADKIVPNTSSTGHYFGRSAIVSAINKSVTNTLWIKAGGYNWAGLSDYTTGQAVINLTTGAVESADAGISATTQNAGNGWWKVAITYTASSARGLGVDVWNAFPTATFAGDGTKGVYVFGASLVPADLSALPYQRVNTTTDYDSDASKFPTFLRCDGVNDSLQTNAIDFSGTDKMFVSAGVRKLGTSVAAILEFSANALTTDFGTFAIYSDDVLNSYSAGARQSTQFIGRTPTNFASPVSSVLSEIVDFSLINAADAAKLRINGTQQTLTQTSGGNMGQGNYGNHKLYLFMRAGTSLPFNGWFYGSLIKGATLSASQIALAERWLATRTKTVALA